jgi:hypothetical protein
MFEDSKRHALDALTIIFYAGALAWGVGKRRSKPFHHLLVAFFERYVDDDSCICLKMVHLFNTR